MKINMPVTQHEVELKAISSIVSKTDAKGTITYVNRDFLEISGFTEQELIGKNHNIVRHPDMPPAAFEDLWNTIKAGKPWNGIVKNRCKNGDHYWVEANAAPIREGDQVTGYISVRAKPTRQQIDAVVPIYKQMLAGQFPKASLFSKFAKTIKNISLYGKILAATALPVGVTFAVNQMSANTVVIAGAGLIATLLTTVLLTRAILAPIKRATENINAIAGGDLMVKIDTSSDNEIGKMLQALKAMQIKVGFDVNDARKTAEEAMLLHAALDNSSAGFTLGDSRNKLQYMNKSCKALWESMTPEIVKQHQDFALENLWGHGIAKYLENEVERIEYAHQSKEAKNMHVEMYGHQLSLEIIPVHNDKGEYLGRMTQWTDLTAENTAKNEVTRLVKEAIAGKLSARVDTHALPSGFIQDTGKGINDILNAVIGPLNVAADYVDKLANGIIPPAIKDTYNGDFDVIKGNLNACVYALKSLVDDANMLSQAAQEGRMDARADASKHWGDYQKVIEGVNATLDSVMVKNAADAAEKAKDAQVLAKAVEETQVLIEAAKSGDLSNRVSLQGKTGAIASLCGGVNALMEKMTEIITQVRESSESITTAAEQISAGNADLSSRTDNQVTSLEKTASSMDELANTVKQNAENAKQANQLAATASGVAVKGGAVVNEVITTMVDINTSSRQIEDIISVIDGIAFQTNILALNAAVEAARAGEQGRGFAVVAGEVRNLAQRSASAAKEIKQLISASVEKVHNGTKLVEDAGKTMQEIVTSVQRVTDIMGEITAASVEQSAGIDQVNKTVGSMDEATQQNAALVEEATAAAHSLVEQAESLTEVVSVYKLKSTMQNTANKALRLIA